MKDEENQSRSHIPSSISRSPSLIPHPSSFILHPASCILHPSSFILHPSSFPLRQPVEHLVEQDLNRVKSFRVGEHLGGLLDAATRSTECPGGQFVAAILDHRLHALQRIVPMELEGHDLTAILKCLVIAAVACGQSNRPGRYRESIAVPMKGWNL